MNEQRIYLVVGVNTFAVLVRMLVNALFVLALQRRMTALEARR